MSAAPAVFATDSNRELQDRIERLEQQWQRVGVADIISRLDAMQQDLQRLQGDLEVQGHKSEELEKSQREAIKDFDRRLHEIELRLSAAPVPSDSLAPGQPGATVGDETLLPNTPPGSIPAPVTNAPVQPALPSLPTNAAPDEQLAYQQAFNQLKEGRYDQAIVSFRAFLTRYPQGANADNAQYWLGEAYYVKRSFKESEQSFQTLLTKFPSTPKRPDALLKIGFIQYELGKWSEARKVLTDVKTSYPGTPSAVLADNRLQKMTKEGH